MVGVTAMEETKNKTSITYGSSAAAVVALAVILLAINFLCRNVVQRVDVTEDKLFTLSDGSRAVIKELEVPVTIRFYFSRNVDNLPNELKIHGKRVGDLLQEYKVAGRGKIKLEIYSPRAATDLADKASLTSSTAITVIGTATSTSTST